MLASGPAFTSGQIANANGCWNYSAPKQDAADWRVCKYDGTVQDFGQPNWVYDDVNPSHSNDASLINSCASAAGAGTGVELVAYNGGNWQPINPGASPSLYFDEVYTSDADTNSGWSTWIGAGKPFYPMVAIQSYTGTNQTYNLILTECRAVANGGQVGIFDGSTATSTQMDDIVAAMNACTS